jgi:hypothetical protein
MKKLFTLLIAICVVSAMSTSIMAADSSGTVLVSGSISEISSMRIASSNFKTDGLSLEGGLPYQPIAEIIINCNKSGGFSIVASASVGSLTTAGALAPAEGDHIDYSVSLSDPLMGNWGALTFNDKVDTEFTDINLALANATADFTGITEAVIDEVALLHISIPTKPQVFSGVYYDTITITYDEA